MVVNQVNNPVVQEVSVPDSPPVQATPQTPQAAATTLAQGDQYQIHVVKKGDTLWDIAGSKLKGPQCWPSIFELNKDQIQNPDLIYPGQEFKLPFELLKDSPSPLPSQPVAEPVLTPEVPEPIQETPVEEPVLPSPPPFNLEPVAQPPLLNPVTGPDDFVTTDPVVVPEKKSNGVLNAALLGGTIGTVGTGATLIGITRSLAPPLANLGGYATAQKVAGFLASKGIPVPTGPAMSSLVAKIGGPKVAGVAAAVGVGVALAGVAAGGYYLYNKITK